MKNALISLLIIMTLAPLASAQSKAFVYVDQFFIFEPVPHGLLEVTSDVPVIAYLSLLDNTTNDAFTVLGDSAEN